MAVYQIVPSTGKVMTWLSDHKNDILTYGGIAAMTGSVVAAAVGTRNMIREKDATKDEDNPLVKKVWDRSKHYVAAVGLWSAGSFAIHYSHLDLKRSNAALAKDLTAVLASVAAYRERWKNKVGETEEQKVFFDEQPEEVKTVDENGKTKKSTVKTSKIDPNISTAVYFDRFCSWMADPNGDIDLDERTVKNIMAQENSKHKGSPERILFLNEIYDDLGEFMKNPYGQRVRYMTRIGQCVGYLYDSKNPIGDDSIYFTITRTHRRLEDGKVIPTLRIEFNHDGNILDAAKERGILH